MIPPDPNALGNYFGRNTRPAAPPPTVAVPHAPEVRAAGAAAAVDESRPILFVRGGCGHCMVVKSWLSQSPERLAKVQVVDAMSPAGNALFGRLARSAGGVPTLYVPGRPLATGAPEVKRAIMGLR